MKFVWSIVALLSVSSCLVYSAPAPTNTTCTEEVPGRLTLEDAKLVIKNTTVRCLHAWLYTMDIV